MYGNGILTTSGGAFPTATAGNTSSVIREATDSVAQAQNRVEQVIMAIRLANDDAFGSLPTGKDVAAQATPPATSKADALRRATQSLHEAINYLETEANRLGQL